uniref:ABC transporter domain-containing protein n=1 Tax=Manihot esculenta TaxID=3983 RepID=A0A2C9V597_MANES
MASSSCSQLQALNHSENSNSNSNNVMVSSGAKPETVMHSPDLEKGHPGINCRNRQNDIFLTWEELGVTVPSKKHGSKWILQGFTGYAQPGELLAIMGPSGCGKTTLLDALAGRLDSSTKQTGQVLINGRKQPLAYGTSLPNSMSLTEKKQRAEMTIKEMGLQDSIDTRIGGWGSKGLSSGQKRRLSICIEILTRPKLLFLDEPTSGLDSAASYYVMKKLANLAKQHGMSIITSIHQPGCDVFQLFHNLCLVSSGRTIYFGPSSAANKDMEQGFGAKKDREEVIELLVRSYESSATFRQIQRRVREICRQERAELNKGSQANFITQSLVLSRRSFVNMYRDRGYYWLRLVIYIMLGLGLGSVFYSIGFGYSSIQARGSLLMFIASLLTIMAIGGFPSFVEDMKVFQRERLNGHYESCAFVIGNTMSSTPYLLLISLIPGAITYYLVGLQQGSEHFIYFASTLFACMMLVETLMLIVASIVPNFLMGLITGAGIQGLMMLSGGFFRLPNDLPTVLWRYPLYYIAFHKYAYQGLYKNEFEGLKFPPSDLKGPPSINGEEILRNIWQVEMGYSKWVDLAILFCMVVLYRFVLFCVLGIMEKFKPFVREIKFVSLKEAKKVLAYPYGKPLDEIR